MVAPEVAKYKPTERRSGASGPGCRECLRPPDPRSETLTSKVRHTVAANQYRLSARRTEQQSFKIASQILFSGIDLYEDDGGSVLGERLGCGELCGRDQQSGRARTIGSFGAGRNRRCTGQGYP